MLRQQLGTFFNVYASSFAGSHYMFQQAFLPTLKTLYDAPMDSPLHEIDPDDVAKLLINLILVRMNKEKVLLWLQLQSQWVFFSLQIVI